MTLSSCPISLRPLDRGLSDRPPVAEIPGSQDSNAALNTKTVRPATGLTAALSIGELDVVLRALDTRCGFLRTRRRRTLHRLAVVWTIEQLLTPQSIMGEMLSSSD